MTLNELGARQGQAWLTDLRLAQAHFFLLGVAILLPWNSFITAVDYFGKLFPGQHIDRVFSVAYMSVNLVSIAVNLQFQRHLSASFRIQLGLAGYVATLLAVPIADAAAGAGALSDSGYKLVLVAGVVSSALWDGVAQPALFGEAGELPLPCVQVRRTQLVAALASTCPRAHALAAHSGLLGVFMMGHVRSQTAALHVRGS